MLRPNLQRDMEAYALNRLNHSPESSAIAEATVERPPNALFKHGAQVRVFVDSWKNELAFGSGSKCSLNSSVFSGMTQPR